MESLPVSGRLHEIYDAGPAADRLWDLELDLIRHAAESPADNDPQDFLYVPEVGLEPARF